MNLNMKLADVILVIIFAFSWSKALIAMKNSKVNPADYFQFNQARPLDENSILSTNEKAAEIDFLLPVLEYGWAPKMLVPETKFEDLRAAFIKLKKSKEGTVAEWSKQLSSALYLIPDAHSTVTLNGKSISRNVDTKVQVGGSSVSSTTPWKLDWIKIEGKKVLFFASHRFPIFSSKIWDAFKENFPRELAKSDGLIIDVRDHNGGDNDPGFWIVAHLWGGSFKFEAKIHHLTTPLAYALSFNRVQYQFENNKNGMNQSSDSLQARIEFLEKFVKSVKSDASDSLFKVINKDFFNELGSSNQEKIYKRPVFFLANRQTGSAAEDFHLAIKKHPSTLIVGENTAGVTHFGNAGRLQLPHSRIVLELSTAFKKHDKGSFVELTGHEPHIYSPKGQDCLDWVKNNWVQLVVKLKAKKNKK